MNNSGLSITVTGYEKAQKRIEKATGKSLATRLNAALAAGLTLLMEPIRAGAARHHVTGKTERSVRVKKLRRRAGEIAAYKVGINTWYGHFAITGTSRGEASDPYVDEAYYAFHGEVDAYIDEQVASLING